MKNTEMLRKYKEELIQAVEKLSDRLFGQAADILLDAYREDRQIFLAGNGGSAGTANHFVADFGKNAIREEGKRRFRVISLCDNVEKLTGLGNDFCFEEVFRQQLINLARPGDVLIAISASGNSEDLVRACSYMREIGGRVITLSGFGGGKISRLSETAFVTSLTSYERIEDLHLIILHMIVCWFKQYTHEEIA